MPVDTAHPLYGLAAQLWSKCRHAAAGQEAVHAAGEAYLPRLSGQDNPQYLAYVRRAAYYNATGRTLQALRGMVFRREPVVELPAAADYLKRDADGAGTPLTVFAEDAIDELLTVGRVGVLVDYPRTGPARTRDDERAIGARPYLAMYRAEQIINWRFDARGNQRALSLVVLRESYAVEDDEFAWRERVQWRVLRLVEGRYRVQLWREAEPERVTRRRRVDPVERIEQRGALELVEEVTPTLRGSPLDFIPFALCGPRGSTEGPDLPPILDLANLNLSHYLGTADYEHGLHFTGLPTAVVTGHDGQGQTFAIGSATAWVFPSPDVRAFFLEFSGAGLSHLRQSLEDKKAMMAALGARMLAPEKRAAEAADTVYMRHGAENGALASIANATSGALSQALTWCLRWAGSAEDARVQLNTDYLPAGMTAQQITALVAAWQAGTISHETLYHNLQRGDVAQPGIDFEAERARIAAVQPAPVTTTLQIDGRTPAVTVSQPD